MILGRDREQRIIEDAIAALPLRGRAVVFTGEPGIGKSTLAELARRAAVGRDISIITATGTRAESHLPYSGLHQLLRSVRAGISDLPGPQADAILTAFGHFTGHVPDRFLVDLAVTELLATAAAKQSLLVLVDDAHLPSDLAVGDVLCTPVTGAYGYSMASTYNRVGRPAVVFVKGGRARVVLRRETAEDLESLECQ